MLDPIRVAILDAAEAAFKLEPYNRVSVAGVAHDAHVSVGAIYHHFGDKEGLRAAVLERLMEHLVEQHMRPALRADCSPGERLLEATRTYVRFFERQPEEFKLMSGAQHDERESEHAQRFRRATLRSVTSLLGEAIEVARAGQATGELRCAEPGEQVILLWSALYGMCTLSQRYPSPVTTATGRGSLEELAVGLIRVALMTETRGAATLEAAVC